MKSLLITIVSLFLLIYTGMAQASLPIDENTGKTVYTEVVPVEGADQAELYARALNWANTYFPNPGSIIKEKDSENAKISGQHGLYIFKTLKDQEQPFKAGQVKYTFSIQAKDGRYKYQVDDIFKLVSPKVYIEEWLDEKSPDKEANFGYLKQVDTHIKELIANLKEAMGKPIEKAKGEDW